jgi:serine/threonine protein kinase
MESLTTDDARAAGEFRLRARLGVGGMGRVYLGLSPAGRAVAVKVVHPELARDEEFLGRFRSEVAAAQAVNGIYTAQVVAAGLYDDPPWLATAYVPGPTLQQLTDERGPLPEAALWRLAAGLAEALRAVHAAGLIHRDLKPNNVLAAEDGPRVIDFGVSRALDATSYNDNPEMGIGGDLCVVPAADGTGFTAYNLSTGARTWTFRLAGGLNASLPGIPSVDGTFYLASTADRVWQVSATGTKLAELTLPAASPSQIAVNDGILYAIAGGQSGSVYAVDMSTDTSLWSTALHGAWGSMTVGGGIVYVLGDIEATAPGTSGILTYNARTGAAGWQHAWSTNSAANGTQVALAVAALLVSIGETLYALSLATGKELWQLTMDGGILAIEVVGDTAYVGTSIETMSGKNESGRVYKIQL